MNSALLGTEFYDFLFYLYKYQDNQLLLEIYYKMFSNKTLDTKLQDFFYMSDIKLVNIMDLQR